MSVSGCASRSIPTTLKSDKLLNATPESIEMQFGTARLLEISGELAEARKAYLEILSDQSHSPSLHRLLVIAIQQNRLDEGVKNLAEETAAGDPTTELLGDYGYAQFLAGELSAAGETLKKAVSLDPSQKRNVNNLAIVIDKQDRFAESLRLFRLAEPEAAALADLALIQSQLQDLDKARENYSRALDLDPKMKVAAVGLLEVDKQIGKNAFAKQTMEPQLEETRPVRQATWNQPVGFKSDSKREFDRTLATKLLPLMDHQEDLDDVTQQINEIEEKIRVRQENLEKRLESTRQQESARLAVIDKRAELARLQEVDRRLELAEREQLATRPKLAKREDIVKRLELAERKNLVKRDEAGKSDPMASITKLIEENKRIKKRTSQPAQ